MYALGALPRSALDIGARNGCFGRSQISRGRTREAARRSTTLSWSPRSLCRSGQGGRERHHVRVQEWIAQLDPVAESDPIALRRQQVGRHEGLDLDASGPERAATRSPSRPAARLRPPGTTHPPTRRRAGRPKAPGWPTPRSASAGGARRGPHPGGPGPGRRTTARTGCVALGRGRSRDGSARAAPDASRTMDLAPRTAGRGPP